MHQPFNEVLRIQTSPGNFKMTGAGNSYNWLMQSHVQALIWGVLELINCFNGWRIYFKSCEKPNCIFFYVGRGPATYVVCQRWRKGELMSICIMWRDSLIYVCILRLQIWRFILMFHYLRGGPLDQRSEKNKWKRQYHWHLGKISPCVSFKPHLLTWSQGSNLSAD